MDLRRVVVRRKTKNQTRCGHNGPTAAVQQHSWFVAEINNNFFFAFFFATGRGGDMR